MTFAPPARDCPLCPRLAAFREENRIHYPAYFNAPVPSFGDLSSRLLVVGLAPGLKGANRTGRPFTGDYAGEVLYASLKKSGFAQGIYDPETVRPEASGLGHRGLLTAVPSVADSFHLSDCRISNAVRCVPPENKPETAEIKQCNRFLSEEIKAMPNLKVILTLGLVAHKAVLVALGLKQSAFTFGHAAEHVISPALMIPPPRRGEVRRGAAVASTSPRSPHRNPPPLGEGILSAGKLYLLNSYHCSRYNINTGALTQAMFDKVVDRARTLLEKDGSQYS